MSSTRNKLLVMKVYESHFTWEDLERYFSINRNMLKNEVKSFLSCSEKFDILCDRIRKNESYKCL